MRNIQTALNEHMRQVVRHFDVEGYAIGVDYTIEGIYLQGSQNYGTHHENSDVDTKLVIIPSLYHIVAGTQFNRDVDMENGEKCSVKDGMAFFDLFAKGNINNLEMLFTDYHVSVDTGFIGKMRMIRERIVRASEGTMWDAAIGMMIQKRKSLFKGTVTTKPLVERYGYDPKDAVHCVRILDLLRKRSEDKPFGECLIITESEKEILFRLRDGGYSVAEVTDLTDTCIELAKELQKTVDPRVDRHGLAVIRSYAVGEWVRMIEDAKKH